MFRKILVPLDGTARAERVLPLALVLATEFQAELLLLGYGGDEHHPIPTATAARLETLAAALDPSGPPTTALHAAVRRLVARVPALADRAENTTPYQLACRLARGRMRDVILEVAAAEQVDLMLMMAPNAAGFVALKQEQMLAGILRAANMPLLLVPPKAGAAQARSLVAAFSTVSPALLRRPLLVPLDGSSFAEKALGLAEELAAKVCGSLLLVEAVPYAIEYLQPLGQVGCALYLNYIDQEHCDETATAYLRELAGRCDLPLRAKQTMVVNGPSAAAIVECAGRCNPGLLVMASHARSGMSKMVLGSVTGQVLRNAAHPILVVGPTVPVRGDAVAERVAGVAATRRTPRRATPAF